ncbi:MAG: ABC transporter permease [Bacteroidota bacterium]
MKNLGKYFIFLGSMFRNREPFHTYIRNTLDEMITIGVDSIFIVAIISTFMGAVTTVQTAYNLISPWIQDYVVSNVVRDMTMLELSPSIIALVFAGKVGSNIASGLGTMRITEQIDALEVMGINSTSYLVLPKIVASMITFPLLVVLSMFLSIYGGYITAQLTGVISGEDYLYGIRVEFNPFIVTFALIKAVAFAFLVASVSSFRGFYTQGGALEVGQSSTKAVTSSCIAILAADYLLSQLLLT